MKKLCLLIFGCLLSLGFQAAEQVSLTANTYRQEHKYNFANDWLIQLVCNDGWYVYFDVKNANSLQDGHEYSGTEMAVGDYTYAKYSTAGKSYYSSAATYKQWTDEEGAFHILATMTAEEEHDHTVIELTVRYDEQTCAVTGSTKTLTFTSADLSDDSRVSGMFQFIGTSPTEQLFILFRQHTGATSLAGEYTWADVVETYTGMNLYSNGSPVGTVRFCDIAATITENVQGGYDCVFHLIGKDGNGYDGTICYTPLSVVTTDTVAIEAINLEFGYNAATAGDMQIKFAASTNTYDISLWVFGDTVCGEWSFANGDFDRDFCRVRYKKNGQTVAPRVFDGEISCVQLEDSSFLLTGWVDCEDAVHYTLRLTQPFIPAIKTREESLTVNNAVLEDYAESLGGFLLGGYDTNGEDYAQVFIFSDSYTGTFTAEDMSDEYTIVAYDLNPTTQVCTEMFLLRGASVTIREEDGYLVLDGKLLMQGSNHKDDVPEFTLHMRAPKPGQGMIDTRETVGAHKYLREGAVYIEKNGKTYNILGL